MDYTGIFSLSGKKAVVTGGTGYLAKSIVNALLDFGAKVVIADCSDIKMEEVVTEESNYQNARKIKCDLTQTSSIQKMYQEASEWMGGINILIATAAYTGYGGTGTADKMSDEVWETGIQGTLGITFRSIREVVPYMEKSGGSIITFGSLYAWIAPDFSIYDSGNVSPPNYGAGKAAIVQLTRHCASQFADRGIRVNSITPGSYPHPVSFSNEKFMEKLANRTMLKRIGYPDDLVGAIILFASDASKYITGTNISVDGGQLAW